MHDVQLVRVPLEAAEKQAAARNAKHMKLVPIRFHPHARHTAGRAQSSFEIVKKDNPLAKDVARRLTQVKPAAECNQCGHNVHSHRLPDACPEWPSTNASLASFRDRVLERSGIER